MTGAPPHLAFQIFKLRILNLNAYFKNEKSGWAPVTYTCNPSYSGGRDQEDHRQPRQIV
jgi:hypothetical protein